MKKLLLLSGLLLCSLIFKGQAKYYLCEQAGQPFGSQSNVNNMNTAFGAGNWTQAYFQTVNVNALLQPTVCFIYLDGSSMGANELNTFLASNSPAIQTWVNAGGHVVINAAPNEGGNINLGFGATLTYSTGPYCGTINAVPAMTNHAIFSGPATPCGTVFVANYASHGFITSATATAIVTGTAGPVLSELAVGAGRAIFGTVIVSSFMTGAPAGANFKSNILSYIGSTCGIVGINNISSSNEGIRLFPNPGSGMFTIEFENDSEKNIRVTDLHGRTVNDFSSSENKLKLDISSQENGVYLVEIKSNNFTNIIKVVKVQ